MVRRFIFTLSLLFTLVEVSAQTYPRPEIQVDQFVENLFNLQSSDANYEDLYEQMLLLYSNPLELNTATPDELRNTYILSEAQVQDFLLHRQKTGRLISIYELQCLKTFDLQTIYALMPFVVVDETPLNQDNRSLWKRIRQESNNSLILRSGRTVQTQKGYTEAVPNENGDIPSRYLGGPERLYARYRVNHIKDFSLGFTTEKDPGEQLKWDPKAKQYGMDFWSAHFMLENRGIFKKVLVGDYQFMFGQGLVYSAGFAVGKGAEPITTVRRSSLGIKPYTSVLEGMYFRGGAATVGIKNIDITVLGSQKFVDGTVYGTSDSIDNSIGETYTNSINTVGFHRTPTELANKHTNREYMLGTSALYKSPDGKLELGILATLTKYQHSIQPSPSTYNQFDFRGNQNQNASFTYQYVLQNFCFFGESAISKGGGHAAVAGFIGSIGRNLDMSMVARNYSKDYHAFYSNGFGEATRNANERGLYWGLKYRFHSKWTAAAYFDRFAFPYLSYQADGPSWGQEYLARLTYAPSKTAAFFIQYRHENKLKNLADNTTKADILTQTTRRNYAIQADVKATQWFSFRTRIQGSTWEQLNGAPRSYGISVSQDINFDFGKFSISNRFTLFNTDDYDTRQYQYEKNVLYSFSIPAVYGKGTRVYSLIQFSPTRKIDIWFRVARTILKDAKTVGSGLDEIQGNTRTDLVTQLRYKF